MTSSATANRWRPTSAARAWPVDIPTVTIVALTVIALALRLSQLHQSLLGDEIFTYQDVHGRGFTAVLTTVHTGGENSPPLFFLLAWLTAKLGDPTVWIRLPSLIAGTATVPVIYALGRLTVGRVAGLIGAAWFAIGPFTVYYGTEARPYATMTLFVALSTVMLMRALSTRRTRWWALYVLCAVAAAYTHYTCIFALMVQGAWSLWVCRDRLRQPLIASAAAVVLYAPWLPHLRGKQLAVIGFLHPLTLGTAVKDWVRSLAGYASASLNQIPAVWGLAVLGVCLLAGLVAVLWRWWGSGSRRIDPDSPAVLLVALAAATPLGLGLYSAAIVDLWLPRGLSASIPAAVLVGGALLAALPRRAAAVATCLVLATLAVGTARSFSPDYVREPYRAMAAYIDSSAGPRDRVLEVSVVGAPALETMLHRPIPINQMTAARFAAIPPGARAFVVIGDGEAQLLGLGTPRPPGLVLVLHRHYRGSLPTELYVYRRPSAA